MKRWIHSSTKQIKCSEEFDPYNPETVDPDISYYRVAEYYIEDPDDPEATETIIFATPSKDEAMNTAKEYAKKNTDETLGYQVIQVYPDFEFSLDPDEVDWFEEDEPIWRSW